MIDYPNKITNPDGRENTNSSIDTEIDTKNKKPRLCYVVILNDNYTTMEFVIWILQNIFHLSLEEATERMLYVHKKGSCRIGPFTYDIARTKADHVHALANEKQHPLRCDLELEDDNE